MNFRATFLHAFLPLAAAALIGITPLMLRAQNRTAPGAGAAHWRVRLAALTPGGRIKTIAAAHVAAWTASGRITLRTQQKTIPLTTRKLLSLQRDNGSTSATNSTPVAWWLRLRTGDVLSGTPMGSHGGKLAFHSLIFGNITVPLDDVAGLSRIRNAPILTGIAHDHVQFINGDKLSGAMLRFLPQAVQWQSTLGTITIPLARMEGINLAQTLAPPVFHGSHIRLTCYGGTIVTATAVTWRGKTLVLAVPALRPITCDVNLIHRIDILGGNITWLTDIIPQRYIQVPYIGTPWRLRKNRNCLGQALRANGRIFNHGLGTHTAARIVYNLDNQYTKLTFIPAMDQSSRSWGSGTVSVQADGKTIYTSGLLKTGDILHPVLLPVQHVKILTFIVKGINAFGVRGRVDLLDAALLK